MQTIDAGGCRLNANLFIKLYREAKKLAPPRFLTLKLHPDTYKELYALADIPESIQIGATPGPFGTNIMRVCCIKPPLGVSDGIAIHQDAKEERGKITFEIHGVPELVVENISYDSTA